jgi:hypothetical protein
MTEGTILSGSVRFRLDGRVKTVSRPVTGAALHSIAGNPTGLTSGGVAVPNDFKPFALIQDQELVSTHVLRDNRRPVSHAASSPVESSPVESSPVESSPDPDLIVDRARVQADEANLAIDKARVVADTTTFQKL